MVMRGRLSDPCLKVFILLAELPRNLGLCNKLVLQVHLGSLHSRALFDCSVIAETADVNACCVRVCSWRPP